MTARSHSRQNSREKKKRATAAAKRRAAQGVTRKDESE